MMINVLVRQQSDGNYHAHMLGWPEMAATAINREAAIAQVQELVQHEVKQGRLFQVEIDGNNDFLRHAGVWAEDPTYDDLLTHIAAYRQELDDEEHRRETELQPQEVQ